MPDSTGPPWMLDQDFDRLHTAAIDYAVTVHRGATEQAESHERPTYRALAVLHMRAVTIHRAIRVLCELGWTPVVGGLLRTLLDILASVAAVVQKPADAEYMAFRYFAHFHLVRLHDSSLRKEVRQRHKQTVEEAITLLSELDQKRSTALLQAYGNHQYWYQPEYESPTVILKTASSDLKFVYAKVLSSAVHGGHVGLGFFDDDPDDFDINPTHHPRRTQLAIVMSSRTILDVTLLRGQFEGTGYKEVYDKILGELFLPLRKVMEEEVQEDN